MNNLNMHVNDYVRTCVDFLSLELQFPVRTIFVKNGRKPHFFCESSIINEDGSLGAHQSYVRDADVRKVKIQVEERKERESERRALREKLNIIRRRLYYYICKGLTDMKKIMKKVSDLLCGRILSEEDRLRKNGEKINDKSHIAVTIDNRMVRSKNECIFFNIMASLFRNVVYEQEVKKKKPEAIHKNYTVDAYMVGENIWVEFFGMMDNWEYNNRTMAKLRYYEQNGINVGENLIAFMTVENEINSSKVNDVLERFMKTGVIPDDLVDVSLSDVRSGEYRLV